MSQFIAQFVTKWAHHARTDPYSVSNVTASQGHRSAWVITLLSPTNGHLSECRSQKFQIRYILPLYNAKDYFKNYDALRFDALSLGRVPQICKLAKSLM